MQRRGFIVLLTATVIVVAAAIVVLAAGDRTASPAPSGERALPGLAAKLGDLAWVGLSRGPTKIDFAAVNGSWAVVEKGNYPAAQAKMRQLLLGLADLTLVEPKTERPELFARLDLDDPANGEATDLKLNDRIGQTVAELVVGKRRADRFGTGNDAVYLRKPGIDRAWLARGSLEVGGEIVDWLDRRILDIPAARIASIKVTGDDGAILTFGRAQPAERFAVPDAPPDTKFKPAADQPMPDSGVATASFATFDGLKIDMRLVARENGDWIAITASGQDAAEAEAKAINAKVGGWSYAVTPDRAKLLRTRLADLVEPPKGS